MIADSLKVGEVTRDFIEGVFVEKVVNTVVVVRVIAKSF